MHLAVIPSWIDYALACAATLLALWQGGWRERAIAGAQQVLVVLAFNVCGTWACPDWRPLAGDAALFAVCLACALRGRRYWTIPASSFALLSVVSDLMARGAGSAFWTSAASGRVWSYLLSVVILWGVWTSARDRSRAAAPRAATPLSPFPWRRSAPPVRLDGSSP